MAGQTGIMTASYLQSLTKHFAVGAEVVGQRMSPKEPIETGFNVGAKYATPKSTITANLQQLAEEYAMDFLPRWKRDHLTGSSEQLSQTRATPAAPAFAPRHGAKVANLVPNERRNSVSQIGDK